MQRPSVLVLGLLTLSVLSLAGLTTPGHADADVNDLRPGQWSGGVGAGFLTNTPDGVEFALKGHVDYFPIRGFSIGLLGQSTLGGNDQVFGLSAQAKYWWDIPGRRRVVKVVVQGGIGFVGADIDDTDSGVSDTYTSFLIPVGIGLEYTVTKRIAMTAELLLNFTSLGENVRAEDREVNLHTHVMPGFYLGVRF
jgi:Outer membrane protein beta-barrel domain